MIFDLVKDFADVLDSMPNEHPRRRILKLLDEAYRRDVHFIDRHPTTFFQCMWNTCWWYGRPDSDHHIPEAVGATLSLDECGLHDELQSWRREKSRVCADFLWARSLRPPDVPLDSGRTVIRAHVGGILSLKCSHDGCRIATAGNDGMIRLWDATNGMLTSEFECVEGGVLRLYDSSTSFGLAFSPNGRSILAGVGGGAEEWDLGSRNLMSRYDGHCAEVLSVAYDVDGRRIASGSSWNDPSVHIWDAKMARKLHPFAIRREASARFNSSQRAIESSPPPAEP